MALKPVPDGYHTLTPYLIVKGGSEALDFYHRAFGAEETLRMDMPGGGIAHAEMRIGDSPIMLSDEAPQMGFVGPQTLGGSPVSLLVYVNDVDACFRQAVAAGAQVLREVKTQFYGDRTGTLKDPFGHIWSISTHVEDVSPEEIARRMESHKGECC